jgi:hypothetical protein
MLATMAKKQTAKGKGEEPERNPRNKDRHVQPRLAFHLPQELYDAFKAHVAGLRPQPNEAAVLRLALEEYLMSKGAWPATTTPAPEDGGKEEG